MYKFAQNSYGQPLKKYALYQKKAVNIHFLLSSTKLQRGTVVKNLYFLKKILVPVPKESIFYISKGVEFLKRTS